MEPFKIDGATRQRIVEKWSSFRERRQRMLEARACGRVLHEKDMEELFRSVAEGPLGYGIENLGAQQDYADYALIDRGLKLAIVEVKALGLLHGGSESHLAPVLLQAARYAHRHRTPYLMAFDGEHLGLGRLNADGSIHCNLIVNLDQVEAPETLFYFTQYGLFHGSASVLFSVPFVASLDDALCKSHHGLPLPYTCFAYVGDLRNKQTWKMPYRNADGSVDTRRVGHAVNYLLSPGGYRGQKAENDAVPVAATTLVALRLARAYKELGQWRKPTILFKPGGKPCPQELLWTYLYQQGLEDL
jgi:hypothetical protein